MYALVTGASQGIGLEYARRLASFYKYDLLLVSNQEKELAQVAGELGREHGVKAVPLYMDLTDSDAAGRLFAYCTSNSIEVEVLINNAGVFFYNDLTETAERRIDLMLDLHVRTLTKMCRIFGADMKKRGHGYILNMSSMSAWMALPGISTYNATKSYILNLSRSLWYELHPYGVSVTAVCPGAVDTGLYGLSPNLRKLAVAIKVSIPPSDLVRIALKKMFKGKKQIMPGTVNHIFLPLIKHLPDFVVFKAAAKISKFQK